MDTPASPPAPPPSTPPPPPPQQPYRPVPPLRPSGMGCFAKGCLSLIIGFVILCLLLIGCGWFMFNRAVDVFTATEPVSINVAAPSDPEAQAAHAKVQTLRDAVRARQETTVEFTAADINALIATDPSFRDMRGHARVAMDNSLVTLDLSAPLGRTKWKRLRGRWLNAHMTFAFSYVDDEFQFDIKSAEANGHSIPSAFLTSQFTSSFNRALSDSLRRESQKHSETDDWWRHIKRAELRNNNLVVTTRAM